MRQIVVRFHSLSLFNLQMYAISEPDKTLREHRAYMEELYLKCVGIVTDGHVLELRYEGVDAI